MLKWYHNDSLNERKLIMKKFLLMMTMAAMLLSAAGCSNNAADTNEEASLAIACELTSEEYGIGFRKGSDLT